MAVVEIFFATGAGIYEGSNIQVENVDLNTGLIKIMGKRGKERGITMKTLNDYLTVAVAASLNGRIYKMCFP